MIYYKRHFYWALIFKVRHKISRNRIVLQFKISKNLSLLILAHCAWSYGTDVLNPSQAARVACFPALSRLLGTRPQRVEINKGSLDLPYSFAQF